MRNAILSGGYLLPHYISVSDFEILNIMYVTQVIQLLAASCGFLINDLSICLFGSLRASSLGGGGWGVGGGGRG